MLYIKKNLSIENARINFRNFSGKEGRFNPAGKRNFVVFLEKEIADDLAKDGWNIRFLKPRDPDDDVQYYLPVDVAYEHIPPRIIVITSHAKNELSEDSISKLDWADIERADLIIRPYNWDVGEKKGVKAYLKTAYITIVEDEFEAKYRDVPDGFADEQAS